MKFLLGTIAHNSHAQNIARSLHEAGWLAAYHTGGVDNWKSGLANRLRTFAAKLYPDLNAKLARRRITEIPNSLLVPHWRWEGTRLAAQAMGLGPIAVDWIWEQSELSLDSMCASMLRSPLFDAYLGIEHGALSSINRARDLGKLSIVAFLSPHHAAYQRWVGSEYESYPELLTPEAKVLKEKAVLRDRRRDEEAMLADVVHCASNFTGQTLIDAGVPADKLLMVPLGCPDVVADRREVAVPAGPVRFIYSGPVSLRKGAHILLQAWKLLGKASMLNSISSAKLPFLPTF